MIARLICRLFGHRRGKRVGITASGGRGLVAEFRKALAAGKFNEVEELIPQMVRSDRILMRAKLTLAREAAAQGRPT